MWWYFILFSKILAVITYNVGFELKGLPMTLDQAKQNEKNFKLAIAKTLSVDVSDIVIVWSQAARLRHLLTAAPTVNAQVTIQNIKSDSKATVMVSTISTIATSGSEVLKIALVEMNVIKSSDNISVSVPTKTEVVVSVKAGTTSSSPTKTQIDYNQVATNAASFSKNRFNSLGLLLFFVTLLLLPSMF